MNSSYLYKINRANMEKINPLNVKLAALSEGPLGMTMRLHWPRQEAIDGHWNPPAIKEAK